MHHNLLFLPHAFLGERWKDFLYEMHCYFGTVLKDCGRINDSKAVVRYPFKPNELSEAPVNALAWIFHETFGSRQIAFYNSLKAFKKQTVDANIKHALVKRDVDPVLCPTKKKSGVPESRSKVLIRKTSLWGGPLHRHAAAPGLPLTRSCGGTLSHLRRKGVTRGWRSWRAGRQRHAGFGI